MAQTIKTYTYNGSAITDTTKGITFTDGSISPKNWEVIWSDSQKTAKGITWSSSTTYAGGSEAAEKLIDLREQRNRLLAETDWRASSDLTLGSSWTSYRKALRDITDSYQSVDADGFAWPTKPS